MMTITEKTFSSGIYKFTAEIENYSDPEDPYSTGKVLIEANGNKWYVSPDNDEKVFPLLSKIDSSKNEDQKCCFTTINGEFSVNILKSDEPDSFELLLCLGAGGSGEKGEVGFCIPLNRGELEAFVECARYIRDFIEVSN